MRPGRYVVKKSRVSDGSEVAIPPKAQDIKLIGNAESSNAGETQLYATWLERMSCRENRDQDIIDSIGTAALIVGGSILFWATGIVLLGGIL